VSSRHDLACRARSSSAARGWLVFARSGEKVGMWHDVVDTGVCRSANEFDDDHNRQLGHRRKVGQARVLSATGCPLAQAKLVRRAAGEMDQGLGQCRACNRPIGLLARRAMHAHLLKGGLESQLSDLQSGRTRRHCCLPDASPQPHALGPGAAGTLIMVASTNWLAQGEPSYDRAGTWRRTGAKTPRCGAC
jgi:hypothetical protein